MVKLTLRIPVANRSSKAAAAYTSVTSTGPKGVYSKLNKVLIGSDDSVGNKLLPLFL